MRGSWLLLIAAAVGLSGCDDNTVAPRDVSPPAAPRGVYSVTGDHTVYLGWLGNTEPDVAGYHIYQAPCASGSACPYTRVGNTSATTFTLTGLTNGVTAYYAVAAYDFAGNESDLSYQTVFDTPRPEGFAARLSDYLTSPAVAGWDFSAEGVRPWDDAATDVFYGYNGSIFQMFAPDFQTDIQDAGFASTLDAVDFAPNGGWSPTGSVELIPGHCYVVWTRDNHFAKFRVTQFVAASSGPPRVEFDWAYQVALGNPELRARPAREEGAGRRPIAWIR
jgi:hypothetical protein